MAPKLYTARMFNLINKDKELWVICDKCSETIQPSKQVCSICRSQDESKYWHMEQYLSEAKYKVYLPCVVAWRPGCPSFYRCLVCTDKKEKNRHDNQGWNYKFDKFKYCQPCSTLIKEEMLEKDKETCIISEEKLGEIRRPGIQETKTWQSWDMYNTCYWSVYYKTVPPPQICDICGEEVKRWVPLKDMRDHGWLGTDYLGIHCYATTITENFDITREYPELFPKEKPSELPPLRPGLNHRIPIKVGGDWKPKWRPIYHKFKKEVIDKINKEIVTGRCYPAKGPRAITMFCKPKTDKPLEPRFLLDCKGRNLVIKKDKTPLPSIDEIIAFCNRNKYR